MLSPKPKKISPTKASAMTASLHIENNPTVWKIAGDLEVPIEQFHECIRLYGEFTSVAGIVRWMRERHGKACYFNTDTVVKSVCEAGENKLLVDSFRNKYLRRIKSIPIFHKQVRLDLFQKTVNKLVGAIEDDISVGQEFRGIAKELRETLVAAKNEVEGSGVNISQFNFIGDLDEKSDDDLRSIRDELIRKAKISIGGGASGRGGLNRGDVSDALIGRAADDSGSVLEA